MSDDESSALDVPCMRRIRRHPCLFFALTMAACGSSAPPPLGVQSNVSSSAVVLRLHPPSAPIAFTTMLRVRLDAELLGQPLQGEVEVRSMRRVDATGEEGWVSVMDVPTQMRLSLTRGSHTHSTIHDGTVAAPVRYVLDDRGRPVSTPNRVLVQSHDGTASRVEHALESLMRALEFPPTAISPGAQWESRGTIRLSDLEPTLTGQVVYHVLERLERFEGSAEQRAAIISFEALFEGSIGNTALASTQLALGEGFRGQLRLRGAYSVALVDGFARVGRAELEGEVSLGDLIARAVSWRGTMEWNAVPFMTQGTGSAPLE